jgi:hypothetical protein
VRRLFERIGGPALVACATALDAEAVVAALDLVVRDEATADWSWLKAAARFRDLRVNRRLALLCPADFDREAMWPPSDDCFEPSDEAARLRVRDEMARWLRGRIVSAGQLWESPFVGMYSSLGYFVLRYSCGWVVRGGQREGGARLLAMVDEYVHVEGVSLLDDGALLLDLSDGAKLHVLGRSDRPAPDDWECPEPHERFWDLAEEPRRAIDGGGRIAAWEDGTICVWYPRTPPGPSRRA